jgi:choline dehydrogenase
LSSNGFDPVDDHNRPGAIGAGRMPRNAVGDTRVAPADGYLAPEDVPANLTVRAESPVAAVVIDAGRAVAVRLENADVIEAGRVVVSAGVYGSPAILMRSGIGPPGHLREVGVPVAVDLPGVGANLADHPGVDIDPGYRSDGDVGPGIFSLATFRSSAAEGDGPDLALWTYDPFGDPPETTIDVVLLTPEARGTVRLRSADPAAPPRIALPEVTSDADIGRLAEGVRRAWDVANDRALRGVCAVPPAPSPGSDADLRASIRRSAYSYPHVVGTCAMGSPESGAVVDPSGAVYGVDGLSVVDASVIPASGVGFPHLVTVMLAERLSERLVAEA